uniref:Large ribosomal subunit protein uL22c n=1 Tax=Physcomitrium patens TaxID=3218 RepID=A0A7I4EJQ3_PHYPA
MWVRWWPLGRRAESEMVFRVCAAENDGVDQLVRSPLSQAPAPVSEVEGGNKPLMGIKKETQAVLTYIKQSPKKVNLVAELVRGMRVDDALMQMAVSTKRAAKVVAKVVTSARANAIHNFGMDKDRLIVAEAFVGKDKYLKRLRIHGKGKAGQMVRPRCRLTVVVKELSAEKEAELARVRLHKYHSKKIRGNITKLMPHRVLATQWQWSRKPRKGSVSISSE